ncbi:MAG TPA: hypothetical protein VN457_05680, partial [Chlamydiales bacterium]|nr:hypothetical protein [Chlamydiales bacterium]
MKLKTPSKNPFKLASWTLMLIAASFISSPLMAQSEVAASHNQRAHATRPMSAKCKKKVRKALKLPLLCTGRSQPSEGTASNSGANQGNVKAKCVNRSNETQQPAPGSAIAKCLSRSNDAQSQPAQKNAPANATPKCVDRSSPSQNAQKPQAQPKGLIAKGNRSDSV